MGERVERERDNERERDRERDCDYRERERREQEFREQRDRERVERHQELDERRRKQHFDGFLPERRDRSIEIIGGRSTSDGSLTAANLIDAIITHQISQTTIEPPPLPSSRDLHRSPYFPPGNHRSLTTQLNNSENKTSKSLSPNVINIDIDSDSLLVHQNRREGISGNSSSVKNITLGELTESIITKDYSPNPSPYLALRPPLISYSTAGTTGVETIVMAEQWKSRRPSAVTTPSKEEQLHRQETLKGPGRLTPEDRHIIRLAQSPGPRGKFHESVSPEASHFFHLGTPVSRVGSVGVGGNVGNAGSGPLTVSGGRDNFALDFYVKNRIVEAMRTEDEKRSADSSAMVMVLDGSANRNERQQQSSPHNFHNHSPHNHQRGMSGHNQGLKDAGIADRSGTTSSSERGSDISDPQKSCTLEGHHHQLLATPSSTTLPASTMPITCSTASTMLTSVVHTAYHQQPITNFTTPPTYAYPFSALTVASGATAASLSGHNLSSSSNSMTGRIAAGGTGSNDSVVSGVKGASNNVLLTVGGSVVPGGKISAVSRNYIGNSAASGVIVEDRHIKTVPEPKPLLSAQYEALSDED